MNRRRRQRQLVLSLQRQQVRIDDRRRGRGATRILIHQHQRRADRHRARRRAIHATRAPIQHRCRRPSRSSTTTAARPARAGTRNIHPHAQGAIARDSTPCSWVAPALFLSPSAATGEALMLDTSTPTRSANNITYRATCMGPPSLTDNDLPRSVLDDEL